MMRSGDSPHRSRREINASIDQLLEGTRINHPSVGEILRASAALRRAGTGSMQDIEDALMILFQEAVADFRSYRAAARPAEGLSAQGAEYISREQIVRWCPTGRDLTAASLRALAHDSVVPIDIRRFQASQVFGSGPTTAQHGFFIITVHGNPPVNYLVDPTFGQFLGHTDRPTTEIGLYAQPLRDDPERARFVEEILENGYIRLDEERAGFYAEGMGIPRNEVNNEVAVDVNNEVRHVVNHDIDTWPAFSSETVGGAHPTAPRVHLPEGDELSDMNAVIDDLVYVIRNNPDGNQQSQNRQYVLRLLARLRALQNP